MNLKDKVAVITGASSGIGKELAFEFAKKGACVVLAARNAKALDENAALIQKEGGRALAVPTDVSRRFQVEALVHRAVSAFGRIDILVNNAGIAPGTGTILEHTEDDVRSTMEVNFMGGLYGVWAVAPQMEKTGGGLIVFVTSIVGKLGVPLSAAYCASKFATQGLAESIRMELARKNIKVITVCPPGVDTPFFDNNGKPAKRRFRLHPVKKIAKMIRRACENETREALLTIDSKLLHYLNVIAPALMDRAIAKAKGV